MKTPQEGGLMQAKEEGLRRIQIFQQLILELQPSELWENKLLLFKVPGLCCFIMSVLADYCHA